MDQQVKQVISNNPLLLFIIVFFYLYRYVGKLEYSSECHCYIWLDGWYEAFPLFVCSVGLAHMHA